QSGGDGPGAAGVGREGAAVLIPQAASWPEAPTAGTGAWGEGLARLNRKATAEPEETSVAMPRGNDRQSGAHPVEITNTDTTEAELGRPVVTSQFVSDSVTLTTPGTGLSEWAIQGS